MHEPVTHATQYPMLGYQKVTATLWRVIDCSTGNAVGPQYPTRTALLADLVRYARDHYGY